MCYSPICTGPWFPLHLYNYRTVLVHVHRTRGGLDHYTTCELSDVANNVIVDGT